MADDFHLTQAIDVAAEPARVWEALVARPSAWWGAPYLLLEGKGEITMPLAAGEPVVERIGEATALWGHVTLCEPGRAYAWQGQMGMGASVLGEVRYALEPTEAGTRVTVEHDAVPLWGGLGDARSSYDYGWADLNARLRALVETGAEHGTSGTNAEPEFVFVPSN